MEADWEIEIGGDAPIIEAFWSGLIDLRRTPDRVSEVAEGKELLGLAQVLVSLNGPGSPVWTSKCDVWKVESFDADELDAEPNEAAEAISCYIDLLPTVAGAWSSPEIVVAWSEAICGRLKSRVLRCCRADLVIRNSFSSAEQSAAGGDCGVTAYVTACGSTRADATATLAFALKVLAETVRSDSSPAAGNQKLQ